MDVDDATLVSLDEKVWYHQQETGQNNPLDPVAVESLLHRGGVVDLLSRQNLDRHPEATGPLDDIGPRLVADHDRHPHWRGGIVVETSDDVFGVRAVSRREYGYIFHLRFSFFHPKLSIFSQLICHFSTAVPSGTKFGRKY